MMIAGLANVDGSGARGRAHRRRALVDGHHPRQAADDRCTCIAITLLMRLIDAFRVLEVIYILTFGGPGDSTEMLSLHIYKTAFIGQQPRRARRRSRCCCWWS